MPKSLRQNSHEMPVHAIRALHRHPLQSVIFAHIIVPHLSPCPALWTPVQPLVMLQLRIDSAPNFRLGLVFLDPVIPRMNGTCALRRAPAVPRRGCKD